MNPIQERNASEIDVDSEKVVVVTTQLDTFTMFDSNERGADAPSTNIVALLETAALGRYSVPSRDFTLSIFLTCSNILLPKTRVDNGHDRDQIVGLNCEQQPIQSIFCLINHNKMIVT